MGTFALIMVRLVLIIGSGWLFGAWGAAQIARPAAIISWSIDYHFLSLQQKERKRKRISLTKSKVRVGKDLRNTSNKANSRDIKNKRIS